MSDPKKVPALTPAKLNQGFAMLPLLSLIALIPFTLFVRGFIQEGPRIRGWNPAWAGESIVMATGISLGLVLSSPLISRWMINRFEKPGFWRRAGIVFASASGWAIGTIFLWGATLLVHGLWVRNLVKFREALSFDQVLGGLIAVMLFFTIPLALIGGLLARFLLFKPSRAA